MTTSSPRATRPIVGHPVPLPLNLLEIGVVELSDLSLIKEVADQFGRSVVMEGTAPASTLERPAEPLHYRIVDGTLIAQHLPRIMNLYLKVIPQILLTYIGLEVCPSPFERSAITVNILEGDGSRYELHEDSNSMTGILYANTLSPEKGGALRLHYPNRAPVDVQPREGAFYLYDARWVPHEVLPLVGDVQRLSLPMNYFLPTDIEVRPKHLDSYIFGESE